MKGKIGGSTRMVSAKAAGVSFGRPGKKLRLKLRRKAQALGRLDAMAHQPVDLTPRLRKQ
jgi:hypothetical protein